MSASMFPRHKAALLCTLILTLPGRPAVLAAGASASEILEATGVKGGLVVHIGCGDGKFTAALHASESYIVQGLATDSATVMAARESLVKSGDVTIALFDGKTLPYADNLVQLVVADSDSQVATAEIMRVLSPGGVVMTRTSRGWNRDVKDRPDDIDEWTHYMHGPDNNPVAEDTAVGPPRRLRWKSPSLWSRSHEHILRSTSPTVQRTLVANGNHLFTQVDRQSETPGLDKP